MNVLSICGVDGTGKTTLVREIRAFPVVRSPQYHETRPPPPAALAEASRLLDGLGDWADARGDIATKARALFLAMTLGGEAERAVAKRAAEEATAGVPGGSGRIGAAMFARERDPILDSLVYAQFYVQLMQGPWDPAALPPEFRAAVEARCSAIGQTPDTLGDFIRTTFASPPTALVPALYRIYGVHPSTAILLLRGNKTTLQARLAAKRRERGGAVEQHEDVATLLRLQAGLSQVAESLAPAQGTRVAIVDVDGLAPSEVFRAAEQALGLKLI